MLQSSQEGVFIDTPARTNKTMAQTILLRISFPPFRGTALHTTAGVPGGHGYCRRVMAQRNSAFRRGSLPTNPVVCSKSESRPVREAATANLAYHKDLRGRRAHALPERKEEGRFSAHRAAGPPAEPDDKAPRHLNVSHSTAQTPR